MKRVRVPPGNPPCARSTTARNTPHAGWTRLTPTGGYPGSITHAGNACAGLANGTPAFTGTNLTWQQKSIDLSAYAGQTVKLAWRYGSDASIDNEGWYVDDIELTHAQVAGVCSSEAVHADGFEGAVGN